MMHISSKGRTDELYSKFLESFDTFLGFSFERIVKEFLMVNRQIVPFDFDRIGRQWGTIKGAPKGSNSYEIDLLLASPDMSKVMLLECKWRDLGAKESKNVLRKLQEKAAYPGLPEDTEVYYGICARKIADKDSLVNQGVLVLDLEDMRKLL